MRPENVYLIIHAVCGIIACGIVVHKQWKENDELTVNDLSILGLILFGPIGLGLCLLGMWLSFFEKHKDNVLLSRKEHRQLQGPEYKPERWKDNAQ